MGPQVLIPLTAIFTFGFSYYLWITTRHKERMSLIETGQSANLFKKVDTTDTYSSLKWGLVLLSLGVGLAIGISSDIHYDSDGPVYTMPAIAISSGIGFIAYYLILKKGGNKSTEE